MSEAVDMMGASTSMADNDAQTAGKVDHGPDPLASATPENHPARIDCVLICGGVWHDFDFARLELLKLLAEDPRVRTRVFEDYSNIEAIRAADILITYTCDVTP
ncbi:MAG: hypothetical protein ACTHKM_11550, partial [Tsuneonella sp.]